MVAERFVRCVRISNEEGLHQRAASLFSQVARTFACDIRITCRERHADAKSVWELIGLAAGSGTELVIEAEDSQSGVALDRIEGLVARQLQLSTPENGHETV